MDEPSGDLHRRGSNPLCWIECVNSKPHSLSIITKLYAFALLFDALHGLAYAYAINEPELLFGGFTLALLAVFAKSTFSTAAILELVTGENTRIRMEIKYHALMSNSAKLASLGEMAGGLSHEINNPLAVIQLQAEYLHRISMRGDSKNNSILIQCSEMIKQTCLRISKITHALRDFARDAQQDPTELIKLSDQVEDTMILCQEKFKSFNISFTFDPSVSRYQVQCRRIQIVQTIMNLISNSFDAISELPEK